MAAAAILNFWIYKMLLADSVWRAQKHHCAKFCQNRSFCCGDNVIFRIFKMAAGFVWGIFGPPTASTWGSSSLCKIWFLSMQYFYNMNVSIFGVFGWITPIHTPKIGVLGQFDPLNGLHYQPEPKNAHTCVSPRHLSHDTWKHGNWSDL